MDEHPQLKRIDSWIATLEQKARVLLDGLEIDAEEMKPKERVDSAVKLVTLMQRYMALRQHSEEDESPKGSHAALAALMRQMRGEVSDDTTEQMG
jgi:hypothetical protein